MVDCRNEYEFICQCMEGDFKQSKIDYSFISGFIGALLVEIGEFKKAQTYLTNSVNWNHFNVDARFENVEAKLRGYKEKNKGLFAPEEIADLRKDLNDTYPFIYRADDFSVYLRKVGFLLSEETRYEAARAVYQLAKIITEQISGKDKLSDSELSYIDSKLGNNKRYGANEMIAVLKSESVNFHIHLQRFMTMLIYINNEKANKNLADFLDKNLALYQFASGDMEVRLVSVKFNTHFDKTYDYVCNIDDVKEGDMVLVPSKDKTVEVKVMNVAYYGIDGLPLDIEKYKEVLSFVRREGKMEGCEQA